MEWKRVLLSKAFLGVLAALIVLNCFLFSYMRTDTWEDPQVDGEVYHEQLQKLSECTWEEALQWCVSYQEDAQQKMIMEEWDYEGEEETLRVVAVQLQSQYEHLLGYDDYLNKISAEAKWLQTVSLFSDPNSVAYKNTVKTEQDFSGLTGKTVTAGHDLSVTTFFEDKWTDYSILLLMCVICGLFMAERKAGLWSMVHAAPRGRGNLALTRIGILLSAAFLGSVLLIGSKILLCGWEYHGLGEWGRTIQSIPMFRNVPTSMTVGQFWVLYIIVKALGAFWIGLLLWAMLSVISDLGLALCASGLFLGLQFTFTAIPSSSLFAPLRYVNVFSYIDYISVFTRYLNISVFGGLISGNDLVLLFLPILGLIFVALNIIIAQRKYPVTPTNRLLRWLDSIQRKINPRLAGGGEFRKLLIKRKGILVLLLLGVLTMQMEAPPRTFVEFDPYIQHYQQRFAGPITEEKLADMEEDLQYIIDISNYEGLRTVLEDAKNAPEGAWILPTASYDAIWSNNEGDYHRNTALAALLILVLVLAPIGSQERQDDMNILLRSTPGGRRKLFLKKQLLIVTMALVVFAAIYGGELYRTAVKYDSFAYIQAPAYSLKLFRWLPVPMSILWVMVLYYAAKLLVLIAAGEVCYYLSSQCSKNRTGILLCCGVVLIPAALAAIGSFIGEYFSFILPLGGAELLHYIS